MSFPANAPSWADIDSPSYVVSWHTLYGTPELVDSFLMAGPVLYAGESCYAKNSNNVPDWSPLERAYPVTRGQEWWVWRLRPPFPYQGDWRRDSNYPVGFLMRPAGVEDPMRGDWQPNGSFIMETGTVVVSCETEVIDEVRYRMRWDLVDRCDPVGKFMGVSDTEIVARLGGDYTPRVSVLIRTDGTLDGLAVMFHSLDYIFDEVMGDGAPTRVEDIAERLGISVEMVRRHLECCANYPTGSRWSEKDGWVAHRRFAWRTFTPPVGG